MEKPNIVFVNVDQMHHQALSAYGNNHVSTPGLDRIANEGYSLMESHSAMPQCSPARASWFTGRMSSEHGSVANRYSIDPEIPDLGQWLRMKGGYETVHTGKWHVCGRDVSDSFEIIPFSLQGRERDEAVSYAAAEYIENYRAEKPLFLVAGLWNPHDCCSLAKADQFEQDAVIEEQLPPLPDSFDFSARAGNQSGQLNWTERDWRMYIYYYYRLVEAVDREVGRIYDAVRASRIADNTIVIFSSDHGDGLGYHANLKKGYLENESWRTPTIVSWPGKIPSNVRDNEHLVSSVDLAATVCDYAEVPPMPKNTIARSWRPLMESQEVQWREYVVGETSVSRLSVAIRERQYKTIFYEDEVKLYDIIDDPLEMLNLAQSSDHVDIIKRHKNYFREYLGQIDVYRDPTRSHAGLDRGNLTAKYAKWYNDILLDESC